jgi:hypothetical protein
MTTKTPIAARHGRMIHDIASWIDCSLSNQWRWLLGAHRARLERAFASRAMRA